MLSSLGSGSRRKRTYIVSVNRDLVEQFDSNVVVTSLRKVLAALDIASRYPTQSRWLAQIIVKTSDELKGRCNGTYGVISTTKVQTDVHSGWLFRQTVLVRLDVQGEEVVWVKSLVPHAFDHVDVAEVGEARVVDLDVS